MNIHSFVNWLKIERKLYSQKQLTVIESMYIYIDNGCVYKVCINVVPEMIKKARKMGISNVNNVYNISPMIQLRFDEEKYKKGKTIAVYNTSTQLCTIFEGEESEYKQYERLQHYKRSFK